MLAAGYTAVGEFHYLGFEEALAAAEAAAAAGVELVLLYAAYARGGLDRIRQASVAEYLRQVEALRARAGSASASPPTPSARARATGSRRSGATRRRERLVLHVHADEQPREIEECLAEHGCRPIELLERTGCLGPHVDRRPRDARRRRRARSARPSRHARLRLPDDRGRPRRRLPARGADRRSAGSGSASAPTRTSASTRSRSCASSRESRGGGRAGAASSPTERLLCFGADEGAPLARAASRGRRSRSTSGTRRCAASRQATSSTRSSRLRRGRDRQPLSLPAQYAVRSRYAVWAARPRNPQAPS